MNWLDVLLILIVVATAAAGIRRGFVRGTLDLIVVAIGLLAGAVAYRPAGRLIARFINISGATEHILGFLLVAVIVNAVVTFALGVTVGTPIRLARTVPAVRWSDDVLGAIPGLVKGVVLAAVIVLASMLLPIGGSVDHALGNSRLAQELLSRTTGVTAWAEERTGLSLADFTIITEPEGEAGVKLPFQVSDGLTESQADESKMLELLNTARRQHGLAPLTLDPQLSEVARAHSREMFELGYFAHDSPVAGSPADRLQAAGIQYMTAGENLAYAPSVEIAHRGLMQSPGHRANILSPEFTRVGIGVIDAPNRGKMFTQDFAG